jgi:EAL domain-containing protein (putative c-di-GMP-specific phosphodiesterase class I)/GGDEF domain-containing protein
MLKGMRTSNAPRFTWQGWTAPNGGGSGSVTSTRLPADAPVQSRLFPKTRSWIALGAPLELLSPLSVLRILYAQALVLWAIESVTLPWPPAALGWLIGAIVLAGVVWARLLAVKEISPRTCRALIGLGTVLAVALVHEGHSTGPVLASALLLVPLAMVVALYLGLRAVVAYQGFVAVTLWLALAGDLHPGPAAAVVLASALLLLSGSLIVQVLIRSVWRSGSIDPETGLANGVGLAQRISGASGSDDGPGPFVVAALFLSGIDDARQALGYRVGSELLRRAVEDLGQVVPVDSVITRVEGDELVLTLDLAGEVGAGEGVGPAGDVPGAALAVGLALARTLDRAINSGHYLVDRVEVSLRAHVGLVFAPWDGTDVAELVRRASLSARRAASSGSVYAVWDGDHGTLTGEDLALLADLRLAASRGELHLEYQPQMSVLSGRTVSVEALLRWHSPAHGNVPPGRFIVLAERTGLIDRLTQWVVSEALDAQVRWRKELVELPVSVNLSAKTLRLPDLSQWILAELDARRLPASALAVEVTETAAVDLLQAVNLLRPLHDHGIRVSIDDFGTGYTSLAAIPHLPLDEIKVDMSFVKRSLTSPADEAIVRSVHELTHRLGLVSVAEGVEDAGIERLMTEIGFDLLQGYHFARPLSEGALLDFVGPPVAAISTAHAPPNDRVPSHPELPPSVAGRRAAVSFLPQ